MESMRGEIRVADQVVAVIAGVVAADISGVSVRSGGFYQDLAKKFAAAAKAFMSSSQMVLSPSSCGYRSSMACRFTRYAASFRRK